MNKLSFDEIKALHEKAKSDGAEIGNLDLAGFSQFMQQGDQQNDWSSGHLPDNMAGSVSRGIDSFFEATQLPQIAGNITGGIGSGVDSLAGRDDQHYENIGRSVGEGLPRMAADVGMFMGGAALTGASGGLAAPVGLGLMGASVADAGLKGYADSGSVGQGVTSAALMGLAPGIGSVGQKMGLSVLGKIAPKALYSSGARASAAVLGEQGAFMGAMGAEQALHGENPFTMDNLFANAVGMAAFAPLIAHGAMKVAESTPQKPLTKEMGFKATMGDLATVKGGYEIDQAKLTNWLLGDPDEPLPNMLKDKSLVQALEMTGLINPVGLGTKDMMSELANRRRAKEMLQGAPDSKNNSVDQGPLPRIVGSEEEAQRLLKEFPEGSTIEKLPGSKQPVYRADGLPKRINGSPTEEYLKENPQFNPKNSMIVTEDSSDRWRVKPPEVDVVAQVDEEIKQLAAQAADLLQVDSGSLVDTIKIIQAANKFETAFARKTDAENLQKVGLELPTTKGKEGRTAKDKFEERKREGEKYGVVPGSEDPVTGKDLEQMQTGLDPYAPLKGMRPNAVKSKTRDLGSTLQAPEFSQKNSGSVGDSNVFRFVKGPVVSRDGKFQMLGSAQIGQSGEIHQNRFLSATQMPKQVFELVKKVYPEAWNGENVNVNKLAELEKQRPLLETHVYGQDGTNEAKAARDQAMHELEARGISVFEEYGDAVINRRGEEVELHDLAPQEREWVNLIGQELTTDGSGSGPRATSYYDTISPFDTKKYPVVRIDVTTPAPDRVEKGVNYGNNKSILWRQDDLHENLPNTLGWAMVQFVPDPRTGETVMFVAEQQSRWGQERSKWSIKSNGDKFDVWYKPSDKPARVDRSGFTDKGTAQRHVDTKAAPHELLDLQHKLVLKAAMEEARKRGVTKMVVSDGETAMMTEGHDKVSVMDSPLPFNEGIGRDLIRRGVIDAEQVDYARRSGQFDFDSTPEEVQLIAQIAKDNGVEWTGVEQPSQADGMRQHYDSVLQSAAEKMTGGKGVPVDMGEHKNASGIVEPDIMNGEEGGDRGYKGSPVFRNPDGTPKANAIGKMYDINAKVVEEVRYSKILQGGANDKGIYTAESLREATEKANEVEATPDMAVARVRQQVKNKLAEHVQNSEFGTPIPLMERVFNAIGLDPALKEKWMAAAQRVMDVVHRQGTSYLSTGALEGNYGGKSVIASELRGVYFPDTKIVGVTVERGGAQSKELAAFDALSTLAHESTHNLLSMIGENVHYGIDDFRAKHAQAAREFAAGLSAEERYKHLVDLFSRNKALRDMPGSDNMIHEWATVASKSPEEFLVEYTAGKVMEKATPEVKRNDLRFVPEALQNFVKTVIRGMSELKKMVFGQDKLANFENDLEMIYAKDPVLEGMKESVVKTLQASNALENGDIGGNGIQFSKVGIKELDAKVQEHLKVRQSNWFVRNVFQHAQIAAGAFYREHFPTYHKVMHSLLTMDGHAVATQHAIRKAFMVSVDGGLLKDLSTLPDSKLTQEQIQRKSVIGRIEASEKLQRKTFDAMLKSNELTVEAGEKQTAYPTFEHPEIQKTLEGLTDNEKADIQQVYNAYLESNAIAADLQVKGEVERFQYVAADYLLGGGVPHDQAYKKGVVLLDGLLAGDMRNVPPELLANEGAQAFIKHWEYVLPKFEAFKQNLDRPYFTEFRSGNYGVRYNIVDENGKVIDTGYRATNDQLQWKAIQRDVASDPRNQIISVEDHRKDPKGRFGQMQTRGLEEATNLVRAHYEAAMKAMRPDIAQAMDDYGFDPARPLVEAANQDLKTMAPRRLAPGRESINMIAAQDAYSSLISRKLANTRTRLETNWLMKHESWNQDVPLKQEVDQFRNSVLSAGRQEFQTVRKLTTLITMGGNVSSAMVDATQPIAMGLWRATQMVGFQKALKYTVQGFVEAVKPLEKMTDKGFRDILVEAINRGYLKTGGTLDNFMSPEDTMNYNVVKAQSNRDLANLKTRLTDSEFLAGRVMEQFSKLGQKTMEVAMTPMRLSAQLNNKNSLWVGYKMGLDKGLKGQELFNFAINTMQTINLQGQRAAHSSFKLKAGQANGLVETATLMTNYPIAVFAEMVSSWQGMLKSSGLDAATRHKSMQAFAGQVLTQMAFAGVAGMGLKGLFAFAKDMFGVDAEEAIREGTAAIDKSGTLGEVLLNGVMNSLTGVDVASRFDLSGVGGLNPYTGFDAKGLFGAGGGMITALYNAPEQFAKGDMSKVQLIPAGIRRMVTAWGDDAYKDMSGQQIINPTVGERFTQMIGFKPARMAKLLEQKSTMRDIDKIANEQSAKKKADQVVMMQQGKMPELLTSIQQDVLADMQGPEYAQYSPQQLKKLQQQLTHEKMLELVNYGVEKLLPLDTLQQGTGQTGQLKNTSAEAFGNNLAPRQSEVTREALKQSMMQQLGMKLPRNAPKAIRNAKMVDELIRQNPTLTRSQALAMLDSR